MPSPIDVLYKELFGELPEKPGSAFERLSAIALFALERGSVTHDTRLRGAVSNTVYQIDVLHQSVDGQISKAVEAKDHSHRGSKVGRGEIQKLAGAQPDLQGIDAYAFFSATGYTGPAKDYADAVGSFPDGKPLTLYHLSDTTEADMQEVFRQIVIRLHIESLRPTPESFVPIFTEHSRQLLGQKLLIDGITTGQIRATASEFLDRNGLSILTMYQLTSGGFGDIHREERCYYGCYWLPGHHLRIEGLLLEIRGMQYKIPCVYQQVDIEITDDRNARLALRDEDGAPLAIFTDDHIRRFRFDEDGRLIPPDQS